MSENITLSKRFYINTNFGCGKYNSFGMIINPLNIEETHEDFREFIKNDSIAKINWCHILSNINYIDVLYLDPNDSDNRIIPENENIDTDKSYDWFRCPMISKELVEQNPKVYQMLKNGHKVIIAWCLHRHASYCKENCNDCDFIESRLNNNLFTKFRLMKLLVNKISQRNITWLTLHPSEIIKPIDAIFWYYSLDIHNEEGCTLLDRIREDFKDYQEKIKNDSQMIQKYSEFHGNVVYEVLGELGNESSFPVGLFHEVNIFIAEYYIKHFDNFYSDEDEKINECSTEIINMINEGKLNKSDFNL